MLKNKITLTIALLALPLNFVLAEDLGAIFKKVNDLVTAKNFPKAIEELGWARKEIEKLHLTQLQSYFPDTVGTYKGEKVSANSALGFSTFERTYTEGAKNIKVSLTGGTGGATAQGFGQLAALGQMAAMFGGAQGNGQDTFRIAGRTATLELNEGSGNGGLTIFLESGSILKVEMNSGASREGLQTFAEALQIDGLDKYLKGQA